MKLNKLANDLGSILLNKQLKIVTAESCTGGFIAQSITAVAGSSNWFLQGWVTYSNQSKTNELDVPAELITKHGAVSEPVAKAMASSALFKSGADIAISTTGIAGPDGGTEYNPVGTVWLAIAIHGRDVITECLHLDGNRSQIREQTVAIALKNTLENIL